MRAEEAGCPVPVELRDSTFTSRNEIGAEGCIVPELQDYFRHLFGIQGIKYEGGVTGLFR